MSKAENLQIEIAKRFGYDPLGYIKANWRWKEGSLSDSDGPDKWQTEFFKGLARSLRNSLLPIKFARASGHGIGKTAAIAWLVKWFMATRPCPQIVVTANTKPQLQTKTWRELAKWHMISCDKDLFKWTASKFYHVDYPEVWCSNAIPWSEENSDAFQGAHDRHVLFVFDEGSNIADVIWEVAEGSLTTSNCLWVVFGNPTRNIGRFKECFTKYEKYWDHRQIDARDAKMSNKAHIAELIEMYGEDSDFVRVRVKGQFPTASSMQLIPEDLVDAAIRRQLLDSLWWNEAKIMSVDIARGGICRNVIAKRQGQKLHPLMKLSSSLDTMDMAGIVGYEIKIWDPDVVFIEEVGIGVGTLDRLRKVGFKKVFGYQPGGKPTNEKLYYNLRMEIWDKMRAWLRNASIPDDKDLRAELVAMEYGFDNRRDLMQLQKKEDMVISPDCADAAAGTFVQDVMGKSERLSSLERGFYNQEDYDPLYSNL